MPKNLHWEAEIEYLKSLAEKTGMKMEIKWGGPVYTLEGTNVVGVGGFKSYFGLWFYKGALMSDPKNLLVNAQEGKTQSMRQMRFLSKDEIDEVTVVDYMKEAVEIEKKGLVVEFESQDYEAPILTEALAADSMLAKAYGLLTPYKQKEYREYIATAKQEKTRLSRLEKIKPMILAGKGIHDKYR